MTKLETHSGTDPPRRSPWPVRVIAVLLVVTLLGLVARAATNTGVWWGIDGVVLAASLVMGSFAWFASRHGNDARPLDSVSS